MAAPAAAAAATAQSPGDLREPQATCTAARGQASAPPGQQPDFMSCETWDRSAAPCQAVEHAAVCEEVRERLPACSENVERATVLCEAGEHAAVCGGTGQSGEAEKGAGPQSESAERCAVSGGAAALSLELLSRAAAADAATLEEVVLTPPLSRTSSGRQRPPPSLLSWYRFCTAWETLCRWWFQSSGIGEPSVYHALVVIFLEFFAWGLLTTPMITVLNETFPNHTFLMNGLIVGIKGLLSFLSAPLLGALSDVWGRKVFLLVTVFFTCAPIPLMRLNTWWYFATISISGVFAVTFSVVFAYVADVTEEAERSAAYGLVSATFAASLVTSPALGAYLAQVYDENMVIALSTAIAVLDVLFILVAVPESLPEKLRPNSWDRTITWEQADPFAALKKIGQDRTVLLLCLAVFLSYLPEAGQYSCFFVYLRLVMKFSQEAVAMFIATVGILSVIAQTAVLSFLMRTLGAKHTIMVGLVFEMLELMWYGFGSQTWMMWAAGALAAMASISYPAISAFVSMHADADKQGVVQGVITGMRGLCNGLGPALFGFIFYLFHVDLEDEAKLQAGGEVRPTNFTMPGPGIPELIPGPPFVFGALLVICALLVAAFIPDAPLAGAAPLRGSVRKASGNSNELHYEFGHKKKDSLDSEALPLETETL